MLDKIKNLKNTIKLPQNSRTRILMVVVVAVVVITLIASIVHRRSNESSTVGITKLNAVPNQIDSTPGASHVSKAYLETLLQSDKMNASNALKSGKSSLPTIVNPGNDSGNANQFQAKVISAKSAKSAQAAKSKVGVVDPTLAQMIASGAIDTATGEILSNLSKQNVSASEYAAELNQLVREGKLTPAQAQALLAAYRAQHGDYSNNANDDVGATGPNAQLAQLQRLQDQQQLQVQQQSLAAMQQAQQQQQALASKQAMQNEQSAMSEQAKTMFASWNPPTQSSKQVLTEDDTKASASANAQAAKAAAAANSVAMIKAGSIMFAVLDTAINSDEPGPVMATIVSGQYKGAKLLGSLKLQTEGVQLQFNVLSMPTWTSTINISAYAINPNTARTALASDVNHHYISRYGSVFAASFLQGYANALNDTGTTVLNTTSGTVTTTKQQYSAGGRTMVALGQVGQNLGNQVQQNFNRPTTVKVDSGVGMGILFMQDVKQPSFLKSAQ